MRRTLSLLLACASAWPVAARASDPPPAVVTVVAYQYLPGDREFPELTLSVEQGGHLLFAPADNLGAHSIVSVDTYPDATPLFWAEQIGPGQTTDVTGVPGLRPGTYQFYCSNHPDMQGDLTVTPR